ncbi:hypothetical protein JIG36_24235 [Actinoplanes sp. LDG1-06]|uniref:Lipoprotein n=1 Tax=Paractinoplanes ovalisporus TaxID=2810368 RepID=A0ABS2AFT0_9ACTN|nr:hypothetical protein [Actinoplanes ovalisporus]MBM2618671.1 hypothetical protein [Actinoplanes ovalisporus]
MRTGKVVVVVALLALASACGAEPADGNGVATAQSGTTATPSASSSSATTRDEDMPLKYAQCMRANGMTWFPDPDPSGRVTIRTPKGMDPKKFEEANKACREFAPNGGDTAQANPEMIEQARKMAKCMRENGVPDFPDPQANGSIQLDRNKLNSGPGDATFDKAEEKCQQFLPDGAGQTRVGEGKKA